MRLLFFLLIFALPSFASTNYLMSDSDFTDVKMFPVDRYVEVFGREYGTNDVHYAWEYFSEQGINPLVYFLCRHKEGCPRDHWSCGCGRHLMTRSRYESFEAQVWCCANTLRGHFDSAESNGYRVRIFDRKYPCNIIITANRSSYALYRYTPRYKQLIYGDTHGNWCLPSIWAYLKKKMEDQ